jgi:hypothetical protein
VKTADCAAPTKLIHVVNESCAGFLFKVKAYILRKISYISRIKHPIFVQRKIYIEYGLEDAMDVS